MMVRSLGVLLDAFLWMKTQVMDIARLVFLPFSISQATGPYLSPHDLDRVIWELYIFEIYVIPVEIFKLFLFILGILPLL